jgi:small subunit ribosomal protein S17
MAEEEDKTPQDETPPEEAEGQPEAEAPAEPAAEAPAEAEAEAPAGEPAAEEAPAEEAPADDSADVAPAAAAPAPDSDDEEGPSSPKQVRKRERSRFDGEAKPQRSPADRAGERAQARSRKAQARGRWRRSRREKERSAGGAGAEAQAPVSRARGERKVRQGVVVSSKADKTITVRIDLVRAHRVYGKVVRNSGTLHAHDERNQANEGDVVRVIECRPLSRTKRWRLLDVLEKAR